MTNKINYDVMSMDIIDDAIDNMGYTLSQVVLAILTYCERRGIKISKAELFEGDPERFYGIISKAFSEESENGSWKKR